MTFSKGLPSTLPFSILRRSSTSEYHEIIKTAFRKPKCTYNTNTAFKKLKSRTPLSIPRNQSYSLWFTSKAGAHQSFQTHDVQYCFFVWHLFSRISCDYIIYITFCGLWAGSLARTVWTKNAAKWQGMQEYIKGFIDWSLTLQAHKLFLRSYKNDRYLHSNVLNTSTIEINCGCNDLNDTGKVHKPGAYCWNCSGNFRMNLATWSPRACWSSPSWHCANTKQCEFILWRNYVCT